MFRSFDLFFISITIEKQNGAISHIEEMKMNSVLTNSSYASNFFTDYLLEADELLYPFVLIRILIMAQ